MSTGPTGGFQARNTPAERRAFFDLDRQLREINGNLADFATKSYVDTQDATKANKTDFPTPGVAILPATNWIAYGGGYQPPIVVKAGNLVTCYGLHKYTGTAAFTSGVIATIPAGYRPAQILIDIALILPSPYFCRLTVDNSGNMQISTVPPVSLATNGWVAINMSWSLA